MSQDFKKVLCKDNRLNCTDSISYAVNKGAQQMTPAQFRAITATTSSHTFNIQVPSEQTLIDRRVLWSSQVVLKISGTAPAGQFLVNYGLTDAPAPFILHNCTSVMTATINNNSVSINMQDVLPVILRFNDKRELQRYNGMTPVAFDSYYNYADAVGASNNPNGGFSNQSDNDLSFRGSWVLDAISSTAPVNGVLSTITPQTPSTGAAQDVYVALSVTEPLLMSPFIYGDPQSNNQAFYGIQNCNFVFNMNSGGRAWRSAVMPNGNRKSCSIVGFNNSTLLFNFLTGHPSDLFSSRNTVGYYELPRFISSLSGVSLPSQLGKSPYTATTTSLQTSNIQLNQVPDKLIIMVRQPATVIQASDGGSYADAWMCIKGVSISWNNQSGILSAARQEDLYRYSVENGSNQSWSEYSGLANNANSASGNGRVIPTCGSVLCLQFGKDINIVEDFYASGSLGNFQLQLNLQVYNQTGADITNVEIVLITMNSGLFVCERGTSSTYTGILTKQDVLDASQQEPQFNSDAKRMVGGGFLDTLKSVVGRVLPLLLPMGKKYLEDSGHPVGKVASKLIGALGYGASGGGHSGGRLSKHLV